MERGKRFSRDWRLKAPRVVINVGGQRFETHMEWLKRHPTTLLGSEIISQFYDVTRKEYFFDRDPHMFRYILNFYSSGKLHASPADCLFAFYEELEFFGISASELGECCWSPADGEEVRVHHYAPKERRRPLQNTRVSDANRILSDQSNASEDGVQTLNKEINNSVANAGGVKMELTPEDETRYNNCAAKAKNTGAVDENQCQVEKGCCWSAGLPGSKLSNLVDRLYGLFIVLSIAANTVETVDCSDGLKCSDKYQDTFFALDTMFIVVFSLEFLIRFSLSSSRCAFMKDFFNIIDLMAIFPYYLNLIFILLVGPKEELVAFRVLRVFRIMKLTRRSSRLKSLILTLKNCYTDLLFMYFTFTLGIVLFASVLYYTEREYNNPGFMSIPHALWYSCVTMMTTG